MHRLPRSHVAALSATVRARLWVRANQSRTALTFSSPRERHLAAGQERRNRLGEQLIEQVGCLDPEVGEGVLLHPDPAGEPPIRVMLVAQPIERPRRADPLERRVQPERDEDRQVDRRPAAVALDRPDPGEEGRQIEALDEGPHEAGPISLQAQ